MWAGILSSRGDLGKMSTWKYGMHKFVPHGGSAGLYLGWSFDHPFGTSCKAAK